MSDVKTKDKETASTKKEADKVVTKELEDTFPASDPPASTQPNSGITGAEPPPKGAAQRDAKSS
jgi:hypothetical protein